MLSGKTIADFDFISPTTFQGAVITGDANYDQAKYDAICTANFIINPSTSNVLSIVGLKTLPSNYLVGGTGTSVPLTATIPTVDISGVDRPISSTGSVSLGAYQYNNITDLNSKPEPMGSVYTINEGLKIYGAQGSIVAIYELSGQLLKSVSISSTISTIPLNKGFYIVVTGFSKSKVLVK